MKRAVVVLCLACLFGALSLQASIFPQKTKTSAATPAVELSRALATVTGIAISPLLGTGVYGLYLYSSAEESEIPKLPWFAHPEFFIPALVIAGLCAAKDTFGVVFPPGLKKPLDVAEVLENKMSGLIAAGAVVPITMDSLTKMLTDAQHHAGLLQAAHLPLAAIDFSRALDLLTVPLGIVIFAMVWMVSHAINVLILLSPWGAIDAALKAARLALLGLITGVTHFDPKSGGVLCIGIVIVAYFLSGWSFRLMVFGSIFCWDFFSVRRTRFAVDVSPNLIFSSSGLVHKKVPIRTYGTVETDINGMTVFRYRPWLLFPERRAEIAFNEGYVGRGLFLSTVYDGSVSIFTFPPRYRGHEHHFSRRHRLAGVRDAGLRRAWGWLKEGMGLGNRESDIEARTVAR